MRRAVERFLCEVFDGQVHVNGIKVLKGQRGFAVDLAICESPAEGSDAGDYPIAEEG
jgi:hypothetical protein